MNENSLSSDKVEVINDDAFVWLKTKNKEQYDLIIIDFPDPSNFSLGKLYSDTFYKLVARALKEHGRLAVQSTSPYFARKSYWCIGQTMEAVGLKIKPYHAYIPSFGEWGYFLGAKENFGISNKLIKGLKFINTDVLSNMFIFPPDMSRVKTEVNKLNNQILVRYFEDEWSQY